MQGGHHRTGTPRPAEVGEEDCAIMALIDRHYLARPYYGSRRMAAWLAKTSFDVLCHHGAEVGDYRSPR
jgi:hypothetical protein